MANAVLGAGGTGMNRAAAVPFSWDLKESLLSCFYFIAQVLELPVTFCKGRNFQMEPHSMLYLVGRGTAPEATALQDHGHCFHHHR